jgi:hypothetical protein
MLEVDSILAEMTAMSKSFEAKSDSSKVHDIL